MKTFFFYGYVLGLTLASPITRSQECKDLRRTDNTENNGDHQEHIQMQLHSGEIPKMDPTMRPSLNNTISGMQVKKTGVKKQTSSIEIRTPIVKNQRRRDLTHLTQKPPKKRTGGKKHRPHKMIQSHTVYNTSRKIHVSDKVKHKLEKGNIIKHLQKRNVDYEDTPNDPYHSPDISYDWDSQEDFNKNDDSQQLNESAGSEKNTEDFTTNIISDNTDPTDSSESDHTSSNESSDPRGSPESSSPMGPDESNSSNESNYKIESEDSISDVTNNPVVLNEVSDSLESTQPNVQNSPLTTPATETTNGLSESKLSSESWSQDNSSQSNEADGSNKSSDSSSSESSNSSDSNTSSHSKESTAHIDNSTEDSSQYTEGTVITDVKEENEIHNA